MSAARSSSSLSVMGTDSKTLHQGWMLQVFMDSLFIARVFLDAINDCLHHSCQRLNVTQSNIRIRRTENFMQDAEWMGGLLHFVFAAFPIYCLNQRFQLFDNLNRILSRSALGIMKPFF